jgi:cyanophycinase
MHYRQRLLFALVIALGFALIDAWSSTSTVGDEPTPRLKPFSPQGHLVLVGGGTITPEIRTEFAKLARAEKENSRLVIIPTASADADDQNQDWKGVWLEAGFHEVIVLHSRQRQVADDPAFAEPLLQANAVWLAGGDQQRLADAYAGTNFERKLMEYLNQGGVVGGTSAGAAIASQVMITGGREQPELTTGLDLLPNSIIDQHFRQRDRGPRLAAAVAAHPLRVGLGLDESTAVVIHQRSLRILGSGNAHVYYAATDYFPAGQETLRPGQRWIDWTTLVRTARERQRSPFPGLPTEPPSDTDALRAETSIDARPETIGRCVPQGSLLIVGGGGATPDIWQTFVDRAGGVNARIVVLPTAVPDEEIRNAAGRSSEAQVFRRLGVRQVEVLPNTDESEICEPEFCEKLASATGIWFGGGRQWRFVDVYENTPAVTAMFQCLERGGIIGGSSAGASIQGELLIRGAPVGNQIMVQDGYRRGFAFLPGVGIDQHFSQRNRFTDLEMTIRRFPSMLGIGIDESTAILVEKSQARILGRGAVYFYDVNRLAIGPELAPPDRPLKALSGTTIDLRTLNPVE